MHNNSTILQNNFKRRRKCRMVLKPVNPIRISSTPFTKIAHEVLNCFKRKKTKVLNINDNIKMKESSMAIENGGNDMELTNKENRDLSPLFREITAQFFENQYQYLCNKTSAIIGRSKSESSLCSATNFSSKESCRRKRSKISKVNKSESSSVVDLKSTRQCLSANAFLTTSFFSLSHAPEYPTYPIHVNLRYAEESSIAETTNRSSQYSERDILEVNKHVKTSTRGLLHLNDNATQSEKVESKEYLEQSITRKIAHFYQITPVQKNKSALKKKDKEMRKVSKSTNTSIHSTSEEPKILYTNNATPFLSTDDTTMESKVDSEEDNVREKPKRKKNLKPPQPVLTRNCFTSTSDTCICAEMCPKFKEWYESLQNNMKKQYPKFQCCNQINCVGSNKIQMYNESNETQENNTDALNLLESIVKKHSSKIDFNSGIDCKDAIRKLSELLVEDIQSLTAESSHNLREDFVAKKNLLDILNQRYPTFIGFQINNNESRKVRYSVSKKIHSSHIKTKVPKIIIREKKKRNNSAKRVGYDPILDTNIKKSRTNSDTSVISITARSADVLEIRGIIESLLPKDPMTNKMKNTEISTVQETKHRQSNDHLNDEQILKLEVEKIVDELLDEIPSTSKEVNVRESSSNRKRNQHNWTADYISSNSSLTDNLKTQSINLNVLNTNYANKLTSPTVSPLFHKIKIKNIKKRSRSAENPVGGNCNENPNSEEVVEKARQENNHENYNKKVIKLALKSANRTTEESVLRPENATTIEKEFKAHKLTEDFYAHIIQRSLSSDRPIICSKISNSSTKSSIHEFVKSLLLCLKYHDSNTTLQDVSIQCENDVMSTTNISSRNPNPTVVATSYFNQPTIDNDDKKRNSILKKPKISNKVDKANMVCQQTNSVGIQVFIATSVKDKQVSSPSLTRWKSKRSTRRDIATQTKAITKIDTSSNSSSVEYNYPASNKKVSEVQADETNIRILPEAMVQKINDHFKTSNHKTTVISKQPNDIKTKRTKRPYSHIRHIKSNYVSNPIAMSTNNLTLLQRKSTGSLHIHSDQTSTLTSSSASLGSNVGRQNNCILKTSNSKYDPLMYSDMGDGDVQNLVSFRMLNYFNNVSTNVFYSFHNEERLDSGIKEKGIVNKDKTAHSQTILVTSPEQNSVIKDVQTHTAISQEHEVAIEQENDSESDIYKVTSTDTFISERYIERLRHIWLKSGLRQHFSQLSKLKLRPIHERIELERPSVTEPPPVLEQIDITSVELDADHIRESPQKEKDALVQSKIESFTDKAADIGKDMGTIHPVLFKKLQTYETNRRYEIPISGSGSDTTDIEPSLANVEPAPEEPNPEFVEWLLSLGIPLRRISEHSVQTSASSLKAPPIKRYDDSKCTCDNIPVVVKATSESDEGSQDYKITCFKDNIILTIPPEKFNVLRNLKRTLDRTSNSVPNSLLGKKNKVKEGNLRKNEKIPLEVSSYESVFELKPQKKRSIKIKLSRKNAKERLKAHATLESNESQNEIDIVCSGMKNLLMEKIKSKKKKIVTIVDNVPQHDKARCMHQNIKTKKPRVFRPKANKIKFINNKYFNMTRDTKGLDDVSNNLQTILDDPADDALVNHMYKEHNKETPKLLSKKSNATFRSKRNLHESFMSIGERILDRTNPPKISIPIEKLLGEKLYSRCSKAEEKISKKLPMPPTFISECKAESSCDQKKKIAKQRLEVKIKSRNNNRNVNSISNTTQVLPKNENFFENNIDIAPKSRTKMREGNPDEDKTYYSTNTISVLSTFSKKYKNSLLKRPKDLINNGIIKKSCIDRSVSHYSLIRFFKDVESNTSFKDTSYSSNNLSETQSLSSFVKVKSFTSFFNKIHEIHLNQIRIEAPTLINSKYAYSNRDADTSMKPKSTSLLSRKHNHAKSGSMKYNKNSVDLPKSVQHDGELYDKTENIKFRTHTLLSSATKSLGKLIAKYNIETNSSRNDNYQDKRKLCKRNQKSKTSPDINNMLKNKLENISKSDTIQPSPNIYFRDYPCRANDSKISIKTCTKEGTSKLSTGSAEEKSIKYLYLNSNIVRKNKKLLAYDSSSVTDNDNNSKRSTFSSDDSTSRSSIKENLIRRSLDNFFDDVLSSFEIYSCEDEQSIEYKNYISEISTDVKKSQAKVSVKPCKNNQFFSSKCKRISRPEPHSGVFDCFNTEKETSTTTIIQNSCELYSNLSENTLPWSSNTSLKPEDVNDIWEIIRLLSKLCPRVLCQYYIRNVLN